MKAERVECRFRSLQSRMEKNVNKEIKRMTYRFKENLRTQETVLEWEGIPPMHNAASRLINQRNG